MARPITPEVAERMAVIRSLLLTGSDPKWVIQWCQTTQAGDPSNGVPAKTWVISRQQARRYVDAALEDIGAADALPKDRKRARNRGLHVLLIQKLMAIGTVEALKGALKGADQLCRIDGSYDSSSALGPTAGAEPATDDEAIDIIEHAAATLALARERKRIASTSAAPPTVINVDDAEPDDSDAERPDDAN